MSFDHHYGGERFLSNHTGQLLLYLNMGGEDKKGIFCFVLFFVCFFLVCFKDIYPAAPHHYLVVPIVHIGNCHSLHRGNIGLVRRMAEMGRAVLHEQGIPPYTSVPHLHLHVLAPASQISEYLIFKFIPASARFITADKVLSQLKNSGKVK
uniref:HIT domain-containing protein n=1 Tax=Mola mola TaxID=94237 RepID=A0A3Q3WRN0_MOLML